MQDAWYLQNETIAVTDGSHTNIYLFYTVALFMHQIWLLKFQLRQTPRQNQTYLNTVYTPIEVESKSLNGRFLGYCQKFWYILVLVIPASIYTQYRGCVPVRVDLLCAKA